MSTNSEKLTAEESLAIITDMIHQAQSHMRRHSFYYLFWGWVIAIANLGSFVLQKLDIEHYYLIWLLTIPAWAFTIFTSMKTQRERKAATHFDSITLWLWVSFGVTIFALTGFGWKVNYQLTPLILIITAIPTMVSGIIIRFKPLIFGAVFFWICGITSFFFAHDVQALIGTVAIIGGYLIPGYKLRSETSN